ncbi:MAG TPA: hypothetical protein VFU84_04295, partial [Gaiellaceae bacterium]|nr:hypothetical protein [Gaiellaceae bacterium]
ARRHVGDDMTLFRRSITNVEWESDRRPQRDSVCPGRQEPRLRDGKPEPGRRSEWILLGKSCCE